MSISSPDATGLGVDVARVLLEFGLHVTFADMMTDGGWALLVFRVRVVPGTSAARWSLLKRTLELICPRDTDALHALSHIPRRETEPFMVKISGHDRTGMLHRITQSFQEADCSVFKAHISTDDHGHVMDTFWIHDNKGLLPGLDRSSQISDRITELLGEDVECFIVPAPSATQVVPKNITPMWESGYVDDDVGGKKRRLACKDATSHSNLRTLILTGKRCLRHWSSSDSLSSQSSLDQLGASVEGYTHATPSHTRASSLSQSPVDHLHQSTISREFDRVELVSVDVDSETSKDFILLQVDCIDRKGLLYDIFVQLKAIRIRVANCRTTMSGHGRVHVELMIQDAYGDVCSEISSTPLIVQRVKDAVAKPVHVLLGNGSRSGQYRLMVIDVVDAGGRGRPRVTYDVTKLLSSLDISVSECEIFVEEGLTDEDESFEVHKFVIQPQLKSTILSEDDKSKLIDAVVLCLQGKLQTMDLSFMNNNEETSYDIVVGTAGYPNMCEDHQIGVAACVPGVNG